MAVSAISSTGITLQFPDDSKLESVPAVLVRLSENVVRDIRRTSREKNGVQFVTGATPKLRLGTRTVELNLLRDNFRTELFSSSADSPSDLTFSALVSHRAEAKPDPKDEYDTSGSDAALAALQSKMAAYEQEKQANQTNFTTGVIAEPKNRWEAAAALKSKKKKRTLATAGPDEDYHATSTPRLGLAPTSMPVDDAAIRTKAMKTALIHLLAIRPATTEHILKTTHIPKNDLTPILGKIGKQEDGKWQLTDRAFKELDVYAFDYQTKEDRKAAVDNAIRSYDRLRIGKEEKIWQLLLPVEDRNKGIVLSKLNLGGGHVNRGLTPHYGTDGEESKPISTVNTPRLGASPKPPGGVKDMFSKKAREKREAAEAKEKKRKEREAAREAAQSDREAARPTKRQATKSNNPKVKSAEFVHSSDEESSVSSDSKALMKRVDSKTDTKSAIVKEKEGAQTPSEITVKPRKLANTTTAKAAASTPTPKAAPSTQRSRAGTASTTGKVTPLATAVSAPSSKHKSRVSPPKAATRTINPSPLGAARPRAPSDLSERSAAGVKRARPGSDSPKGLGITNGAARKRQATVTSTDSNSSSNAERKKNAPTTMTDPARKPMTNGVAKTNGVSKAEHGVKRKASDMDGPAVKHRKTGSTSSQSQSSFANSTARTSPDPAFDSGSSGSPASIHGPNSLSYEKGVDMAEKFTRVLYPKYNALYDKLNEKKRLGQWVSPQEIAQLNEMHVRLGEMKQKIIAASQLQGR